MAAPAVILRPAWGANPLQTPASRLTIPTPECWAHHTASTGIHGPGGVRQLQQDALSEGYVDIEYSWLVDNPGGQIYEGRGWGFQPAATEDHNSVSHAICVMGNFEVEHPSSAVLDSCAWLLRDGHQKGYLAHPAFTGGHDDASGNATACPGDFLDVQLPEINRRAAGPAPVPAPPLSKGGAVRIVATRSGKGYWICAADGGVFTRGDARFFGSMGGQPLAKPIVGMAARPQDDGYVLAARDGGIFAFGAARFRGSIPALKPPITLAAPIVDVEYDVDGDGYRLLGADGGVFNFSATDYGNATQWIDYP